MKIQTKNLTGAALDWAVANCEGATKLWHDTVATWWVELNGEPRALSSCWSARQSWNPSTNWSQAGPIIEREGIGLDQYADYPQWQAFTPAPEQPSGYSVSNGATPLIATMRCYVSSRLGDEVDVPQELVA